MRGAEHGPFWLKAGNGARTANCAGIADDSSIGGRAVIAYGDDRQFENLATALARIERENEGAIANCGARRSMAQPAGTISLESGGIVISDRRFGFRTLRYCDVAAGLVQRISGVDFGVSLLNSPQERDRTVALAAEWLKAHAITP